MRTLIAGGGTGGHLTPALSVAQALRRSDPGGAVLLVVRRGGAEGRMLAGAGIPVETITASGLDSHSPAVLARLALHTTEGVAQASRLIHRFRPDVVVGTAGYVCVPVVLAALMRRIPVVLLEQNARPGRAVRLLARRARVVAASFAETAALLPGARTEHTGNPVRDEVLARRGAALPAPRTSLFVMGGSQGAHRINEAVAGALAQLLVDLPALHVTHQTGAHDAAWIESVRDRLPGRLRERYTPSAFFDDVAERIAAADLVVMRAGASSLAECAVIGRPMVLVPYPHAGAHQEDNARPYAEAGAAVVVDNDMCTPERLRTEILAIAGDEPRWRSMAAAAASLGRPDAAERIVALVRDAAA